MLVRLRWALRQFGGMFYLVFINLGLGFGTGAQIIIARRFGEGDKKMVGKTFDHALYFMLPLSILAFLVLFAFSDDILRPLVSSDAIYAASIEFLDYRVFGIFFAFRTNSVSFFLHRDSAHTNHYLEHCGDGGCKYHPGLRFDFWQLGFPRDGH